MPKTCGNLRDAGNKSHDKGISMSHFGELLRLYREQCSDRELEKKNLTQARLAELLSRDLGLDRDHGYTAQTISNWERGRYRIPVDERPVLLVWSRFFTSARA
jgi:hypothetical protein